MSLQDELDRLAELLEPNHKQDFYGAFKQIGKLLEMIAWKLGEYEPPTRLTPWEY